MKALTICQPFAHLIIQKRKTCENRKWPTNYRGPIYIHAGKSKQWMDVENGIDILSGNRVDSMSFGAVVGIAELVACISIESTLMKEWIAAMTEEQRRHVNGPYCWILDKVAPIGPWPWKGALGLFEIDEDELGRVANRILGIRKPADAR